MNVYSITIFFSVILLLLYICDTKKFFNFVSNPYLLIIILGLITRIFFLRQYGYDTDINCFKAWAGNLYAHGIHSFYSLKIFKDYPPGYMYILYLIGAIKNWFSLSDSEFTCLIKIPAVVSDIVAAILVYKFSCKKIGSNLALILSLTYALNPAIIINSAIWGQIDSIYTIFIFLSIFFITEKKYFYSFIAFTIGFLIKPQGFVFAPIFLYAVYEILSTNKFSRKSFYLVGQYILCSSLILIALLIPFTQDFNFMPIVNLYIKTFSSYPYVTINAFNSYMYLQLNWFGMDVQSFSILFTVVEVIFIILITLFSFWFLINSNSKSKYFFTAAILNVLVFVFTFKMHERYIYPSLLFFLMAYIYQRDKRNLLLYGGFSVTLFMNCFMVYYEWMQNKNPDVFCVAAQVFSMANIILTLLMVYFAKNIFVADSQKIISVKNSYRNFKILPAENIEPSRKLSAINKNDWLIILVVTVLYGIVAFFNLGNIKSPESFFLADKNSSVTVDFGSQKNIRRMQILNGVRPDKKIDLFISDDNLNWRKISQVNIDGVSSVFTWKNENLNLSTRYLKLKFLNDETYIQEIAFRDGNNEILPVKIISETGGELFDEQSFVPETADYMNSMYFDEVYHARTGYEFLHGLKVYETTHPPLGKNFIALGIKIFGMTPFGWRFFGTLCGVLMLPIFYLLAKKIFASTLWATFATVLFSFDFMHFEQTRIATVDSYTVFFIILMFLSMYIYYNTNFFDTKFIRTLKPLALCAVFSALACASKWQGFYALAGLAVIFLSVVFFRYKEYLYAVRYNNEDIKNKFFSLSSASINICIIFILLITIPMYFFTYFFFAKTAGINGFADVLKNQDYMFSYHAYLNATHPFSSKWWQWILNLRPILFYNHSYSQNIKAGISCFINPIICYGGLVGFFYCISKISRKFDKTVFFLLVAYFFQIIPWVFITRLTFEYHYFPCVPFLILMLTYFIKDYAYPKLGKKILIAMVAGSAVLFAMFYPVLCGMPVSVFYVNTYLKWFSSWQLY